MLIVDNLPDCKRPDWPEDSLVEWDENEWADNIRESQENCELWMR